jgi:hypothetical protein
MGRFFSRILCGGIGSPGNGSGCKICTRVYVDARAYSTSILIFCDMYIHTCICIYLYIAFAQAKYLAFSRKVYMNIMKQYCVKYTYVHIRAHIRSP